MSSLKIFILLWHAMFSLFIPSLLLVCFTSIPFICLFPLTYVFFYLGNYLNQTYLTDKKEIRDGIVLQRTDKRTEGRKRGAVMIPGGQRVGELMTQVGQSLEVVMTPGSLRVEFIVLKEEVMKIPGGQRLAAPGARVGIMTLRPAETKTGMIKFQFFEF